MIYNKTTDKRNLQPESLGIPTIFSCGREEQDSPSNGFIRIGAVRSLNDIVSLGDCDFVSSNMHCSLREFFDIYSMFENKENTHINRDKSRIYGKIICFMMDTVRTTQELKEVSEEISSYFENLPYFSYTFMDGRSQMLALYICERHYFPGGVLKTYNRDIWKKSNGTLAKPHSQGAVLVHKKGEPIETKNGSSMTCFSIKSKALNFGSESTFIHNCRKLKVWFFRLLEELFDIEIKEGAVLPKMRFKSGEAMENNRVRELNEAISGMIKDLDKFYECIINGGADVSDKISLSNDLSNLYRAQANHLKDQSFRERISNAKIKYKLSSTCKDEFFALSVESFVEHFKSKLCRWTIREYRNYFYVSYEYRKDALLSGAFD